MSSSTDRYTIWFTRCLLIYRLVSNGELGDGADRPEMAGQRLPPCRFERPLHNVHQSSNHERPVWSVEPPVSVNTRTAVPGRVGMWRGGSRFWFVCCRPFRLAVPE